MCGKIRSFGNTKTRPAHLDHDYKCIELLPCDWLIRWEVEKVHSIKCPLKVYPSVLWFPDYVEMIRKHSIQILLPSRVSKVSTPMTYIAMSFGQLLGCSWQSSFRAGVDPIDGHRDHLALFSGKLGKDLRLETAQHQTLLQQQLQLSKIRRARVVPAPSHL